MTGCRVPLLRVLALAAACIRLVPAQAPPPTAADEHWRAIAFLEGTWEAKTRSAASGANAGGTYTFQKDLGGRLLARHAGTAACAAPAGYNCDHRDLLFVYQEAPGQALKAIYFDNEGHVIHYDVSTPAPGRAVFLSAESPKGPRFRLVYELKGNVMGGEFEMRMPGKTEWTTYLEWSGAGQPAKSK